MLWCFYLINVIYKYNFVVYWTVTRNFYLCDLAVIYLETKNIKNCFVAVQINLYQKVSQKEPFLAFWPDSF